MLERTLYSAITTRFMIDCKPETIEHSFGIAIRDFRLLLGKIKYFVQAILHEAIFLATCNATKHDE